MPVRVDIPIRMRVDPHALQERQACIYDALAAAASRALVNSRRIVLTEREGYVGVAVHPPAVVWTGDGLSSVPETVRAEVEEHLVTVLTGAAQATGIYGLARARKETTVWMSSDIYEILDPERFNPLLRLYEIPSYDDDRSTKVVQVEGEDVITSSDINRNVTSAWDWKVYDRDSILKDRELLEALYEEAVERFGEPTEGEWVGLIWSTGTHLALYFNQRTQDYKWNWYTHPLKSLENYSLESHGPQRRRVEGLSPTGLYRVVRPMPIPALTVARALGPYQPDDRQRVVQQLWGERIRADILRQQSRPKHATEQEYQDAVAEAITREIEWRAQRLPTSVFIIIEIRIGDQSILIPAPPDKKWEGDAYLLPVVDPVSLRWGGAGKGEEGRGGRERGGQGVEGGSGEGGDGAEGDGRDSRDQGSLVSTGEEGEAATRQFYPASRYSDAGTQDCSPLLGEPPLEGLGEDGNALRRLIEEIAYLLNIQPCEHAARFCTNAAEALGSRASTVAAYATSESGFTQPVEKNTGNLGVLEFVPTASPAVQFMRHLAGITPLISQLADAIDRIYSKPEHRAKIQGPWHNDPPGWRLHFRMELTPRMKESVGLIFGMTCQVFLLQLLRSSRAAIDARLAHIDVYAQQFETHIVPQLTHLEELQELRDRLQQSQNAIAARRMFGQVLPPSRTGVVVLAAAPTSSWLSATREVTNTLGTAGQVPAGRRGARGEIVIADDNTVRIWDDAGRLWTLEELERALVMRRGVVESIDPLIKQLVELDEVLARFRHTPLGVRRELERLLREMQDNNAEMTHKTEESWVFAFRASKIKENLPAATIRYSQFALQGIHLQAHQQIGEFFRGDPYYAAGINALFSAELGRQALNNFFEFTGLILLAIVCPPLAVAVGIGVSLFHLRQARERERLFASLIDPELVLSRAEVEADLFAAQLGVALSFIPGAGTMARAGVTAGRAVLRRGLVQGARLSFRLGQRAALRAMREQLKHGIVVAFVREIAIDQFMDRLITAMIEPVIRRIEREVAITGPQGGLAGAERTLQRIGAEKRTAEASGRGTTE